MSSPQRVLITGGAGFIGSHLARELRNQGIEVRVLDNFSSSTVAGFDDLELSVFEGDVRDFDLVSELALDVDWIFHQAALVSVVGSIQNPIDCYETNVQGTLNVLEGARRAGARRVVLASSAAVYGESDHPAEESASKAPNSPYAASKLAMEEAAQLFTQEFGLPTVCLRYFNVYGPRQRPDTAYAAVIPAFIHDMINEEPPTIYGDGRQRRDFVSVDDVIRANLLAAASEAAVGSVINISGGQSVTIGELAKILQGIIPNAPAPIFGPAREGDIVNSEAVMGRAWKALGYRPEVALADGLRSTVEWFRNERLQAPE